MCVNEATSSINCEDDDLFKSIDRYRKSKRPKLSDSDQAAKTEIKNSIIYNLNTAHATLCHIHYADNGYPNQFLE